MKGKKKFLLLGYYGKKNSGDDMMLMCLLDWIKKQEHEVKVISEDCIDIEQRFQISTVQNVPLMAEWSWPGVLVNGEVFNLINELRKCDGLIVGGGDLIRDSFGWKTFFYTVEKCIWALLFRKNLYIINSGIGIPVTNWGIFILKRVLRASKLIIVRDYRSFNYCTKIGCRTLFFQPDIVFTLPHKIPKNSLINKTEYEKYFTVALRDNADTYLKNEFTNECYNNFAEALDDIISGFNLKCRFMPFQCNADTNDNVVHKEILSKMNKKDHVRINEWTGNIPSLLEEFKNAEFVIGMRLHSLILAVAYNKGCIAIPYDEKSYELFRLYNIKSILTKTIMESKKKIVDQIVLGMQDKLEVRTDHKIWESYTLINK